MKGEKKMAKKPNTTKNPARRKHAGNAARDPQARRPRRPVRPERGEDMLSEFSDETNTFYTDERVERKKRKELANLERREQKKAEKRKPLSPARRKLRRVLSYAAIITVVLVVGIVLSLTVLFKTQAYEVTGVTRYTESEIISACGINKGENIFLAPKRPAEKRVKNAFPYVEEVRVSFDIPDTIKIAVTEAVEGYLVKISDTDYLVISTRGRILDRCADKGAYALPIFIGPTPVSGEPGDYVSYEDETVVAMIDSITQTFADNGYQGITEIDATKPADISFTYDNRIKVRLGIPEELDYKIRTAMTIINENLDKNQTGTTQGVLDVSRCNSTKRSYFNEQNIAPTQVPTQDPSQPATEAVGTVDGGYDWSEGYTDDGYSDDGYSDDGYSDDGYSDDGTDLEYDYYDEEGYGHFW